MRAPDYERGNVRLYCGDCLELLPQLEAGSVDAVVTDPPYGCGKADWDREFAAAWYGPARSAAKMIVVITGSCGLKDSVSLVGGDFIDVIAARNMNGMTRGPLGFGNWLAAVVAKSKPRTGMNAFDFVVGGDMPLHPSPKPLPYMVALVERVTEPGDAVLDPFMGSGTTGVACVKTGRAFIGMDIEPKYFEIAVKRIDAAFDQFALLDPVPAAKQMELLAPEGKP